MTTSGLQFDRELKTAASQICSSVKSGKRNWLSTLLVIFHYLLYLLTVKGPSFFRSIHPITPMLIPLFIRSWGGIDNVCTSIFLSFIFSDHMHPKFQPSIYFDKLHQWQIHYITQGHSFPALSSKADRAAGRQLSSQLGYPLHSFCSKWHLRQTCTDLILGTVRVQVAGILEKLTHQQGKLSFLGFWL